MPGQPQLLFKVVFQVIESIKLIANKINNLKIALLIGSKVKADNYTVYVILEAAVALFCVLRVNFDSVYNIPESIF